jgi:hypothetical protein
MEECLFYTNEALDGNDVPHGADFTMAEMYVFLGVVIAMSTFPGVSLERLWDEHGHGTISSLETRYNFSKVMSRTRFNQWKRYFLFLEGRPPKPGSIHLGRKFLDRCS